MWTFGIILLGILAIAVAFAFWFLPSPTKGNGQWWKALHWDNRNSKKYD